jgi:hypothetical protein
MPRLGLGPSQGQSALFDAEGNERTGIGHFVSAIGSSPRPAYLVVLPSSRKEFTPTAIILVAVFDFPRVPIIKALIICVAGLKRASNPRQVFQQFAKFIVSYSYGSIRDLYRRVILHQFRSELLGDPAMSAVRPPRIVKFLFCVRRPCCQEQRSNAG